MYGTHNILYFNLCNKLLSVRNSILFRVHMTGLRCMYVRHRYGFYHAHYIIQNRRRSVHLPIHVTSVRCPTTDCRGRSLPLSGSSNGIITHIGVVPTSRTCRGGRRRVHGGARRCLPTTRRRLRLYMYKSSSSSLASAREIPHNIRYTTARDTCI